MPSPDNNPNTGKGRINADLAGAAANLGPAAASLAAGASATQVASDTLKSVVLDKLLGPTALFAGGMIGVLKTIRSIVQQSGILERGLRNIAQTQQIEGKFETLLKSATLAKQRIKELYDFTASAPFKFEDVAEANRLLQALTSGALAGAKGMKIVGDAAAATGQEMSTVAGAVGKVYNALASGRSLDRTLFLLQQTGVVTDELAAELEKLEAQGGSFAEKWAAVEKALTRTEGGMRNEMRTLEALSSRLEETSKMMEKAFSKPFAEAQTKSIETTIKATQNLTPVLAQIGEDLAPILTFGKQFKNSIAEQTLATKEFANGLTVLWNVGKVAFAGLAAAAGTRLVAGLASLGPAARGATQFLSGVRANAKSALAEAKSAGGGYTKAAELFQGAEKELGSGGSVTIAAEMLATAAATRVSTAAMIAHSTAMKAVGTSTGLVAAANYTAAASSVAVGGAFGILKKLASGLAVILRSVAVAVVSNPFTWVATAAASLFLLKKAMDDADKASQDLSESLAETNKQLREQVKAADTVEKWTKAINDLTTAYAKANAELDAMVAAEKEIGVFGQAKDFAVKLFSGRDPAEQRAQDRARQADSIGAIASLRRNALGRRGLVGMSDQEREFFRGDIQQREQLRDQQFSQDFGNADEAGKVRLAKERIALLEQEAKAGRTIAETRDKFDRSQRGGDAAAADQRIADEIDRANRLKNRGRELGLNDTDFKDLRLAGANIERDLQAAQARVSSAPAPTQIFAGQGTIATGQPGRPDETVAQLKAQLDVVDELRQSEMAREDAAQTSARLRNGSDSELIKLQQRLVDLSDDATLSEKQKADAKMATTRQIIVLEQQMASFRQKELDAVQLKKTLTEELEPMERRMKLELDWERKIADARLLGLETASMEMQKQLDILNDELKTATALGQSMTIRKIKLQITQMTVDQDKSRRGIDDRLARDRASLAGDEGAIQRMEDAKSLRERVSEFTSSGRTVQDAIEAEKLRVAAEEARRNRENPIEDQPGNAFAISDRRAEEERRAAQTKARQDSLDELASAENLLSTRVAPDLREQEFNERRRISTAARSAVGAPGGDKGGAIDDTQYRTQSIDLLRESKDSLKAIEQFMRSGRGIE